MLRRNSHLIFSSLLMLALVATLLPISPAKADGGGWGDFFDADGNLLPGVIEAGEVTQPVDWMPDFPAWTGMSGSHLPPVCCHPTAKRS